MKEWTGVKKGLFCRLVCEVHHAAILKTTKMRELNSNKLSGVRYHFMNILQPKMSILDKNAVKKRSLTLQADYLKEMSNDIYYRKI